MNLQGKKIVVVGTGVSGIGAVGLLDRVGADTVLYDGNDQVDQKAVLAKLSGNTRAKLVVGELPQQIVSEAELLVVSPGVPVDSPVVRRFQEAGVLVWGEIELAYNYEKGTVYAITGTNGKTTTTTLVGEIMRAFNEKTFVVGNIGTSYTGETLKTSKDSVTVAEISSFQLETIRDFAPRGTAILNITPDHLDRHDTMENYTAIKESITRNQGGDGFCVLNYDDEALREFGKRIPNPIYFSRRVKPERGAYLDGSMIRYTDGAQDTDIVDVNDMFLFGNHNYENVMAAAALAVNAGVPVKLIADSIRQFKGVEHRIEFVREKDGVSYYNDSKGTNPDSSVKALEAMSKPTILIAGGYDKHVGFDAFAEAFGDKVKLLVLIGATAAQIEKTARAHGFDRIMRTDSLEKAVRICADHAKKGDAVLLSPACASWDMFKSYEQRGAFFKEYVNRL